MRKKAFDPATIFNYIATHAANVGIYQAAKKSSLVRKALERVLPKPKDKKPVKLLKELFVTYTLGPDARYIYNPKGGESKIKKLTFLLGHGLLTALSFKSNSPLLGFTSQHLLRELQYAFERGVPVLNRQTLRKELQDYRKSLAYNLMSKVLRKKKVSPEVVMAWQEGAGAALLRQFRPDAVKELAIKDADILKSNVRHIHIPGRVGRLFHRLPGTQ